jgi:hypothetical protein
MERMACAGAFVTATRGPGSRTAEVGLHKNAVNQILVIDALMFLQEPFAMSLQRVLTVSAFFILRMQTMARYGDHCIQRGPTSSLAVDVQLECNWRSFGNEVFGWAVRI